MAKLDKLTVRGFKSIENLDDFKLESLNVLIGANGAGKSNFVEFFRVLRAMVEQRFQLYVGKNGPADGIYTMGSGLPNGSRRTSILGKIVIRLHWSRRPRGRLLSRR